MLQQDLEQQHYAYEMNLEYDGVDHQDGDAIMNGLLRELGRYRRDRATDLFVQLISTVTRDHLSYSTCTFELFLDADGKHAGPRLGILPGWSLRRRRRRAFQAAPKAGRLQWVEIPANALTEFRLPGKLGKKLYRTRRRLQVLDAHRPGGPVMLARARHIGYDFDLHQNVLDEMAAKVTSAIGWHGRDAFLRRATDSYRIYRRLSFLRSWLTVVAATTDTLNRICSHPGVNAGRPLRVRVTGLPSVEDVRRRMAAVVDGSESLDGISRSVLHPRRT
jgi:hypothetical protein